MSERLQVTIRKAVPSDTPAVLELVSRIWDGQDYVAQVWEEWLGDPSGLLVAADLKGRVVGLGKLSQLTPDDWFLQGLRTHPEFEGRGVAAQIHDYLVSHWIQHGHGALRLATNALRYPVHHLCERTGFRRLGEYSWYEAPALPEDSDNFEPVAEKQAQAVLEYLHASPLFDLLDRLVDMGWEWQQPTLALLQDIARQGRLYWWQGGRGLIGYYLDEDEQRVTVTPALTLAACQLADLAELLIAFRRLAAQRHYDQAGWVAQLRPELSAALEAAGYARLWDGSVYLFEKQHSSTNFLAD